MMKARKDGTEELEVGIAIYKHDYQSTSERFYLYFFMNIRKL